MPAQATSRRKASSTWRKSRPPAGPRRPDSVSSAGSAATQGVSGARKARWKPAPTMPSNTPCRTGTPSSSWAGFRDDVRVGVQGQVGGQLRHRQAGALGLQLRRGLVVGGRRSGAGPSWRSVHAGRRAPGSRRRPPGGPAARCSFRSRMRRDRCAWPSGGASRAGAGRPPAWRRDFPEPAGGPPPRPGPAPRPDAGGRCPVPRRRRRWSAQKEPVPRWPKPGGWSSRVRPAAALGRQQGQGAVLQVRPIAGGRPPSQRGDLGAGVRGHPAADVRQAGLRHPAPRAGCPGPARRRGRARRPARR
jgi:hypothetical protein